MALNLYNPWATIRTLESQQAQRESRISILQAQVLSKDEVIEGLIGEKTDLLAENERMKELLVKYRKWNNRLKQDMSKIGLQTHNCLKATSDPIPDGRLA